VRIPVVCSATGELQPNQPYVPIMPLIYVRSLDMYV